MLMLFILILAIAVFVILANAFDGYEENDLNYEADKARQMPGIVACSAEEWLQKAVDILHEVGSALQKTIAEINTGEAMRSINEAWLYIIKALQSANEMGRLTNDIIERANKTMQEADDLAVHLVDTALDIVDVAQEDAQNESQDAGKRLQGAIQVVENMEVIENAEVHRYFEARTREVLSMVLQRAIDIVAMLLVEYARSQSDYGTKGFSSAIELIGEAINNFDTGQELRQYQRNADALKQSAGRAMQEASKAGRKARVLNMDLSRIIDGILKTIYMKMPDVDVADPISNIVIRRLVIKFGNVVIALHSKFQGIAYALGKAMEMAKDMNDSDAAAMPSRIATVKKGIKNIKKSINIQETKQRCRILNVEFNNILEIIAAEEQARTVHEKDSGSDFLVFDDQQQDISKDTYVLQKFVVRWRKCIIRTMEKLYNLESGIAYMEQCVAEAEQKVSTGL